MSVSIDIILEYEIVLIVRHLHCTEKISCFEARFEYKCLIIWTVWHIKRSRRQLCLLLVVVLATCSLKFVEIFAFTLYIVILYKFFNIDQVSGNLAHWLSQVRIVDKHGSLASQMRNIIASKATIRHITVLTHDLHVLLDVICGGS